MDSIRNPVGAFGILAGFLRTGALICSPFPRFTAKWKNLALFLRTRRDPNAMQVWTRYFDPAYYLRTHPDVQASGIDVTIHFLIMGAAELRSPSPDFDIQDYLNSYPDVARSGLNPVLHLALFGAAEGRRATEVLGEVPEAANISPEPSREERQPRPIVIRNAWLPDLPLVSVVIPCFNYGRYLGEAIQSVLNQTFQNFEIIVVEGGSTDADSVEQVRRLQTNADPRVRFIYRPEPHLVGDNRNFGIALARGRYICCLDADDQIAPQYLEIAAFLAEAFGYDIVYCSLKGLGNPEVRWIINDATFPEIFDYNQITTAALYRKSAWAHCGGYRDWGLGVDYVFEDWEFWVRLLGHGFMPKAIREPLLLYRVHGSGLTATCDGDIERHRRALKQANPDLTDEDNSARTVARRVIGPLQNLLRDSGDARPGFLLALPYITLGGAEHLLARVGQHLLDRGYRLIVTTSLILSSTMPDNSREFEQITTHLYHLRRLFSDDAHARLFMKYLVRRYRVETLLLTGCDFTYSMLPELKEEFPHLRTVDQLFNDEVHVHKNRKYDAWIDATVVPSAAVSDSLVERFNAGTTGIHIIPHGVEIPQTPPAVIGSSNGFVNGGTGKITVAFFGRLSPEKAPDVFVQIVHRLSRRDDLSFVMTGDGPERSTVDSLVKKYKLEQRLNRPGFVDDLEPYLSSADIVVLPSRLDGMPLIVLEAQARGKAVVASRVGSLPHMVRHQETGFLCEPENIDDFCSCISRLADNPVLRREIGNAARRAAAEHHGESKMFAQYDAVFKAAAERAMAQAQP